MTLHMIDIASYQRGINLDRVQAAGFSLVNVKTSQGNHYTFSDAVFYARAARQRGMGVSCFHWLDNSGSGAVQAEYCWRMLRQVISAVGPVALQVDNEDPQKPATWAITRDFVHAISDRMGHLPYMYTGDWWAVGGGRASWDVHSLTPWLMAAPNAGYPGSYPGDQSGHWRAGYWGYRDLAVMQYAVAAIPGAGGGDVSKAAIRDPAVWAALTGGDDMPLTDQDVQRILDTPIDIPNWDGDPERPTLERSSPRTALGVAQQRSYQALRAAQRTETLVRAAAAADEVRDKAQLAAIEALAAGSGNPDAVPTIIAAVNAVRDEARQKFAELLAAAVSADERAAGAEAEVERLRAALHASAQAEADATAPDGTP